MLLRYFYYEPLAQASYFLGCPATGEAIVYERIFNWAFQIDDEEHFIDALLLDQPEPPHYFAQMKQMNRMGPPALSGIPQPPQVEAGKMAGLLEQAITLVDSRSPKSFARRHLPGSINIPDDTSFLNWCGWLVPYDRPFYLVADPDRLPRLVRDLCQIGLEDISGWLSSTDLEPFLNDSDRAQSYQVRRPREIAKQVLDGEAVLVDVRNQAEWSSGHIPGARHVFLGDLRPRIQEIPPDRPVVLQCESGYRSAIAASILQAAGHSNVINLVGGIARWRSRGLPVQDAPAE